MDFNKKEMPIQGFSGFGGGATGAAFRGAADEAKYIDEVFGTEVYIGTGSNKSITNNINLSGKGGMVWVKNREENYNHWLFTSSMGIGNAMRTNNANDKWGFGSAGMVSFNDDGYTVGTHQGVNKADDRMVAWTFRNSKAFQQLTYEGTGSNQNISHSLGSIPGMIIVKNIDTSGTNWIVYHRELGTGKYIMLNSTNAATTTDIAEFWNNTAATATQFTVGTNDNVNKDGDTYIAYLFAGGESTAATAVSVDFTGYVNGSDDELKVANSNSDFQFGTGDFTVECWVRWDVAPSGARYLIDMRSSAGTANAGALAVGYSTDNAKIEWAIPGGAILNPAWADYFAEGTWNHIAVARSGSTIKMFINGTEADSATDNTNYIDPTNITIGDRYSNSATDQWFNGKISNVRIVKGTAVYTSSFRPPTEPLTNITNTKLLCCNNSSVTGSTVTPGTITANSSPTASTDSPFTDTSGFAFGEDEDQQVVATGSYIGNGAARGPDVYLGWQPQYVLIKRHDSAENWNIYDSMRGIWSEQNDKELRPESSALEYSYSRVDLTPTGFKPMTNNQYTNQDGGEYIYLAFRGSDGYVGKPAEAGTEVFSMNSGSASGAPLFDSTHVVDFQFVRGITTSADWEVGARLLGPKQVYFNTNGSQTEIDASGWKYDYMDGWHTNASGISNYMCWMFKRHKGMDVICFRGNSANRQIAHGLNAAPEMIIVKQRTSSTDWQVYHKGLNGGTNPEQYRMVLNSYAAEQDDNTAWNDTAPTATHFSLGTMNEVNNNGEDLIAFLFTSVEGISKCGYYNGSNSDQTITLGFQPRFFMCKARDEGSGDYDWMVVDSARGLVGNSGQRIFLNSTGAQDNNNVVDSVSSTGITLQGTKSDSNFSGREYIYYAHA